MSQKLKRRRANRAKSKLGLADLEHAKSAVLVSLRSPESQRSYCLCLAKTPYTHRMNDLAQGTIQTFPISFFT